MCSFTEPFFTVTYDSESGVITYVGAENFNEETGEFEPVILSTDGDFQAAAGDNEYILVDGSGNTLMSLTLDFEGSDGMSDFIYPFTAQFGESLFGGCETTSAPAVNPYELVERLRR